jgi:hypothetical protein
MAVEASLLTNLSPDALRGQSHFSTAQPLSILSYFSRYNFGYRVHELRLWVIRSVQLPVESETALVDSEYADALFWLRIVPRLEEVRFRGELDQTTQEILRTLVFRADGRAVRVVLDED